MIILNETHTKIIGEVTLLMTVSSLHKQHPINFINYFILPPIYLNQFRIYRIKNQPVGWVSWAFLSDELEKELIENFRILNLDEWKIGKNVFIMDFIAPFGHARKITQDLKNNIFPNDLVKGFRLKDDKTVRKVAIYRGKNVKKTLITVNK